MHISEPLRIRAGLYERIGQTEFAIDDYQAAIDIDEKVSDWRGLSQTGGSLATLYEEQVGSKMRLIHRRRDRRQQANTR